MSGNFQDIREQLRRRTRLPAKLVYDTAGRPLSAGARRRAPASRHLARSTSNRRGEFQVEYPPEGDLSLCLVLGNDHVIEVPVEP